jgi:hypothetical protein
MTEFTTKTTKTTKNLNQHFSLRGLPVFVVNALISHS